MNEILKEGTKVFVHSHNKHGIIHHYDSHYNAYFILVDGMKDDIVIRRESFDVITT